jgi:hypothetical protein
MSGSTDAVGQVELLNQRHHRWRWAFSRRASTERCRNRSSSYSFKLPLQSQQESIVTLPRRIDRFLIDEKSIHDTAHLHKPLPFSAVAREA